MPKSKKPSRRKSNTGQATPPQALTLAIEHFQAGRLQEAEQQLRQVLQVEPENPDAHHFLGATVMAMGRPGDALASCSLGSVRWFCYGDNFRHKR